MKVSYFHPGNLEPKYLRSNKVSRRTNGKKVLAAALGVISVACAAQAGALINNKVSAEEVANTTFEVNVVESLSVSLTTPSEWSSGGIGDFLRNDVNLSVTSNNTNGFTASMYSSDNTTNLTNLTSGNAETLPTLDNSSTRQDFPASHWGYSLGSGNVDTNMNSNVYGETAEGSNTSNYYPLVSDSEAPITILTSDSAATGSQDIYFGAKAGATQASGTYQGTVVISVVTGSITEENPITPTDPALPNTDTVANDNNATYTGSSSTIGGVIGGSSSGNGTTVYTTTRSNAATDTRTTTTTVSEGDVTDIYKAPLGVVEDTTTGIASTTSNINDGTPLITGLAVASATAAASGTFFFILAKRKKDDDEEEENPQA